MSRAANRRFFHRESRTNAAATTMDYSRDNHDKRIATLRHQLPGSAAELHQAYLAKHALFLFTPSETAQWLGDTLPEKLPEVYELVLADYPSTRYWIEYLDFVEDPDLCARAIPVAKADFKNAKLLWEVIFRLEPESRHHELFLERILSPHADLDDLFAQMSAFVLRTNPEAYTLVMAAANKVYSATKRRQRYYEQYEYDLPALWPRYLESINKYRALVDEVRVPFTRYVLETAEPQLEMWLTYVYLLYTQEPTPEADLARFVRAFPLAPALYAEYIRNCPEFDDGTAKFEAAYARAMAADFAHTASYDAWKVLALAILAYRNYVGAVDGLMADIMAFVEVAIEHNDVFHAVEKLAVTILQRAGLMEQATSVLEAMTEEFAAQHSVWLFAVECFRQQQNEAAVNSVFERAISHLGSMDWPERIIEEWLQHVQLTGQPQQYKKALLVANQLMRDITEARSKHAMEVDEAPRKRTRPEEPVPEKAPEPAPVRSRELFTVKVTPSLGSDQLRLLFSDCGTINDIIHSADGALVELDSKRLLLAALTKDKKTVGSTEVTVVRHQYCTLFVTNFPPTYPQADLKQLFESKGGVAQVRFPHQKQGDTRRFCYVEFSDPESAARALDLDRTELEDSAGKKYALSVRYSAPQKLLKVPIANSKVKVCNLAYETDKAEVAAYFGGDVEEVTFPKVHKERLAKYHNDGIAIVLFKSPEAADGALSKQGTEFKGRKLVVYKVKPHQPRDFDLPKTVGLTGLNDTLSREQIQQAFTDWGYPCHRVEIFPQAKAALVEFVNTPDAGKVTMALPNTFETIQAPGSQLKVVSVADVNHLLASGNNKPAQEKPRPRNMMMPRSVAKRR